MSSKGPRVLRSGYDLRSSVAQYDATLRRSLKDETPDPEPYLQALLGDCFQDLQPEPMKESEGDDGRRRRKRRPRSTGGASRTTGSGPVLGTRPVVATPNAKWRPVVPGSHAPRHYTRSVLSSAPSSTSPSATSSASPSTSSGASSSASPGSQPEGEVSNRRRGSKRGGLRLKEAREYSNSPAGEKMYSLLKRAYKRADVLKSKEFSLHRDSSHSSTGWSGIPHSKAWRAIIDEGVADKNSDVWAVHLPQFKQIRCRLESKYPTILLDCEGRTAVVRTSPCPSSILTDGDKMALVRTWQRLLKSTLWRPGEQAANAGGPRGDHFAAVVGFHRAHRRIPYLPAWHQERLEDVAQMVKMPEFKKLTGWVDSLVRLYFMKVASRYEASIKWHAEHSHIKPQFGLFWNFCVNGFFPNSVDKRVHCTPHSDSKNIIGVCVVMSYVVEGSNFDHTVYTWLVIWELGVIIELPPWVPLLYPSALFYHFNIDLDQIRIVQTRGPARPTRQNSTDVTNIVDRKSGRGSVVWFSQASMFQSSETGSKSLKEAALEGKEITKDLEAEFNRF